MAESKADYVRSQGQTREHHCHWPGCPKQVPPAMWGCRPHWLMLPKSIRDRIWRAFVPGQEVTMTPSREYVEAAKEAQAWIRKLESHPMPKKRPSDHVAGSRRRSKQEPAGFVLDDPAQWVIDATDRNGLIGYRLPAYFRVLENHRKFSPEVLADVRACHDGLVRLLRLCGGRLHVEGSAVEYFLGPDGRLRCGLPDGTGQGGGA